MRQVKSKRKSVTVIVAVLAAVFLAFAVLLTVFVPKRETKAAEGDRVTMLDLMGRYPIDYVLGPVDVEDENNNNEIGDRGDMYPDGIHAGQYHYKKTNYEKDVFGNKVKDTCESDGIYCTHQTDEDGYKLTNNIYGIPANQYFNVESYIYTTGEKDSEEGRVLYGWKADIHGVDYSKLDQPDTIAENGEIKSGMLGDTASSTGIYVKFAGTTQLAGTSVKYALIVPKDVVGVGKGSAAYVANHWKYFAESEENFNTIIREPATETDFTDFGCFLTGQIGLCDTEPWFWQPRERLAGVYFPEDSRLSYIEGTDAAHAETEQRVNRTTKADIGKSAFMGCGMSFMILPGANSTANTTGVMTIEDYALYRMGLIDVNIPTSVTSLGDYAFASCESLLHVETPSGLAMEPNVFKGCTKLEAYRDSTLYVFGGAPQNGVLDTGRSGFLFSKNPSGWFALSLAGETGENTSKVFVFPDKEDFSELSDRRRGVAYDYIDCDGQKRKNKFDDEVNEYGIADNFANNVWCRKVVLPEICKSIGSNAFYNSRVNYLETYATKIGANAFGGGTETVDQWFYFHKTKGANGKYDVSDYSIASNAFVGSETRHVIFEDYELYKAFNGSYGYLPSGIKHYQIPIVANVANADSVSLTLNQNDMAERFFNDSDYVKNPNSTIAPNGSSAITYTKRLSGYDYTYIKYPTGDWANGGQDNANAFASPVLSNMKSTVWYGNADYSGEAVSVRTMFTGKETGAINLYTKNIAKPTVNDQDYAFGETNSVNGKDFVLDDNAFATFEAALGLPEADNGGQDYVVELNDRNNSAYIGYVNPFVYASNNSPRSGDKLPTYVQNAGTYYLRVRLDPRWGEWDTAYNDGEYIFTATVTVARRKIDLSSLGKLPSFVTAGADSTELRGENTQLYHYSTGYFLTQQEGLDLFDENEDIHVTNAYVYYTGNNVSIELSGINELKYTAEPNGEFSAIGSNVYVSYFTLRPNPISEALSGNNYETNYAFDFGESSDTMSDAQTGVTVDRKDETSARLRKRWYIVSQTNFFVDSSVTGEANDETPVYSLAFQDNVPVNEWIYEDKIDVKTPRLAYGAKADNSDIQSEIVYKPVGGGSVTLKSKGALDDMSYYINTAMPAGVYVVTFYGDAAKDAEGKSYDAITNSYEITVKPKEMGAEAVAGLHAAMQGGGNAYALDAKKLHGSIASEKTALENTLNHCLDAKSGYWATEAARTYYDSEVEITYNREGSGNFVYSSEEDMLKLVATVAAGEYTFYFRIAAQNYVTVGGAESGADSPDRLKYNFNTVWYQDIKVASFYKELLDENRLYLRDVEYTGLPAYTSIQPNQYFRHSFDDADYVNVGKVSVTFTLYNNVFARWNATLTLKSESEPDGFTQEQIDKAGDYFQIVDGKLKLFYHITPADNGWRVSPQIPAWSFNGFDPAVNFISSGLKFTGASYRFALIPETVTDPMAIDFNTATVKDANGIVYFTVDGRGQVVGAAAKNELNALKPQRYYLKSFVDPIVETVNGKEVQNVNGFEFISNIESTGDDGTVVKTYLTAVTLSKATNGWASTPNVMRWNWGAYNKDRNTIFAASVYPTLKPAGFLDFSYGTDLPEITYYIANEAGETITGNFKTVNDTVTVDGKSKTVAEILGGLAAGSYILHTSIGGTDYYEEIKDSSLEFKISSAVNTWETQPGLTGWTYRAFSDSNFRAGVPTFGAERTVVYTLYQGDCTFGDLPNTSLKTLTVIGGALSAADIAYLDELAVDTYTLVASLSEDAQGNYGALEQRISFLVTRLTNSWTTQPRLTSYPYHGFVTSNFLAGVPTYPEEGGTVYYAILNAVPTSVPTKKTEFDALGGKSFTSINDVKDYLNGLTFGTYYFAAFAAGADNYTELFLYASFDVTGTGNTWTEGKIPSITGWTYNGFDAGLLGDADALYGTDTLRYSVLNVNEEGNIIQGSYALSETLEGGETKTAFTAGELVLKLNSLGAGRYVLVASIAKTENYDALTHEVRFIVTKAANAWENNTPPTITGWTYGDTPHSATSANPVVKEGASITTKYFKAENVNGEWVATAQEVTDLASAGYGTYAMVVTVSVDGDKNYLPLVHTAIFEIARGSGHWAIAPELTLTWKWGVAVEEIEATALYNAAVNPPETLKIRYTIQGASGTQFTEITVGKEDLLDTLRKLSVGVYDVTVFVDTADNDNYTYETRPSRITVTEAEFTFTNASTDGWTWGAADKLFTLAEVGKVLSGELAEADAAVKYGYRKSGDTNWTAIADISTVCNTLYGLNAGTYEVRIEVGFANYTPIDETVSFTISKASYTWGTNPAGATWEWDDKDHSAQTLVKPTVSDVDGAEVTLEYTLNNTTYGTFETLLQFLQTEATEGEYKVFVNVKTVAGQNDPATNYESLTGNMFTVKINAATNGWKNPAPAANEVYTRVYGTDLENKIADAEADFGTVVYSLNEDGTGTITFNGSTVKDIDGLNAWANSLSKGEYVFYTVVIGEAGKYNGLSVKRTIRVNGLPSYWANESVLPGLAANEHKHEFVYTDALSFGAGNVTLPVGKEGTTTYTLQYKNYKDEAINPTTRSSVTEVYAWMNDTTGKAIAGTYTIEATFSPSNENYATLIYTVTVVVERAQLVWDVDFEKTEYDGAYGEIEVPTPSITGAGVKAPIAIKITDSRGTEYEIEGTLSDFVKTLNTGDYVITYSVADTLDYIGLKGGTVRMFIRAVNNVWRATDNVSAAQWTDGYTWTYKRGDDTLSDRLQINVEFASAVIGAVQVSFNGASLTYRDAESLNEYLTGQDLAAGRYTLRFSVEAGENGNYNGLVSNCTVVIERTVNDWTNKDAITNYVGTGKVDIEKLVVPQARVFGINGQSLVRYEIKNLDGTSRGTYTADGIRDAIAALTNGTYTVIARIGVGEAPAGSSDALTGAWNLYKKNYEPLETSFTITLTPNPNGWTTPFEGNEWVYGEKVNQAGSKVTIERPVAQYGNDEISYTLSGKTVDGKPIDPQTFINTEWLPAVAAEKVFDALIAALNKLLPGTYTVTASIAGNDVYYAPETATVLFVVSRAANGWSDDTTADNEDVEWIYEAGVGAGKNQAIVFNQNHGTLKITVNGRNVTEDIKNLEGATFTDKLNKYLSTLSATAQGTAHTIIASVEADGEYSGLTRTVRLTVKRTSNDWTQSLGLTAKNGTTNKWTWDNKTVNGYDQFVNANFSFVAPIPVHGESVVISVYKVTVNGGIESEAEEFTYTLNLIGENRQLLESELSALYNRIIGLDVVSGNDYYYMVATVAYSENYDELNSGRVQFTVTQATNAWTTTPRIQGWDYDGTTAQPTSEAKYGANTVKYYYAAVAAEEVGESVKEPISEKSWTENLPMAADTYWLKAVVDATDNYAVLVGYCKFAINQAENAWVNMPGVIPWAWNGYDINANLFSGSARSNREVTFKITVDDGSQTGLPLKESDFTANVSGLTEFNEKGFTLITVEGSDMKIVSDTVAKLLNVLRPGKYLLLANAPSGENLAPIEGTAKFTVSPANNEWKTEGNQTLTPNVLSFVYGQFAASDFRAGETKYGTGSVLYSVTGQDNDKNSVGGKEAGTKRSAADIAKYIKTLPAGSYVLRAWNPAGATYGAFYSEEASYLVVFNVTRAENAWSQGGKPAASISIDYTALRDLTDIGALTDFVRPVAASGTNVMFSVLNSSQGSIGDGYNELTYADLLKALQEIGYGSFIIRAYVGVSCNYTAISADTSLTITRLGNAFQGLPAHNRVSGSWLAATEGGNDLSDFTEIKADRGKVVYNYNGTDYDYAGIVGYLKEQNAGAYNITVSVTGTNEYEGLADTTIRVDIEAATNSWKNGWTADSSLNIPEATVRANATWAWGSAVTWNKAVPVYGDTVFVEIRKQGAASATYYITVNYGTENGGDGGESAIRSINSALKSLDVGTYTITVTAPAGANWNQLSKGKDFVIEAAANRWTKDPVIEGNGVKEEEGSAKRAYVWTYGTSVTFSAADAFGSKITLEYFGADGTRKLSEMPTAAGSYIVRFIAKEDTPEGKAPNYQTITQDVKITIDKASGFFIEHISANGWVWERFDRTVNRFAATAEEGEVTFAVLNGRGEVVEIEGQRLEGMKLVDVFGERLVEEKFVPYLNKLTAATYKLRASVSETENYLPVHEEVDFVITVATNTWTTIPSVVPWALNQWDEKVNSPVAEAQYGYVTISITQEGSNILYYYSYYDETEGKYVVKINKLNLAEIGWYTMTAEVPAAEGKYQGTQSDKSLRGSMRFQIFVQGSSDEVNYWTVNPAISYWTATTDKEEILDSYLPIGKPARGLPYFVFYKGELNALTGKYERGEEITAASDYFVRIDKGTTYFKDWYLPMAPGHYFMFAYAEREGVASDKLEPQRAIEFDIYERANRFTQDPRIDTLLYLGDRANEGWGAHSAEVLEGKVTYSFINLGTGEVSDALPSAPGQYRLVATATALFCGEISKYADFTVELSPNSWVSAPSIKEWTAEFAPNDPTAAALIGSEHIKYSYARADAPDVRFTERPTEEGSYIMYAELALDGYETLTAEYAFTVAPAYDTTFLIVDIVLGCLVAIFTVVVIYYAIRRYREC